LLYRFENYVLDRERRELRRDAMLLSIEPQVFDLLVFLVGSRDRVVSKDDMLASVWGGRIVSESTLASRINAVRRVIGDNGREQRLIRTVIGKGIRFVGPVREQGAADNAGETLDAETHQPSIAVLPFTNLSGDPEQEYFVDGMVEEIITALSRIRWLFVIARNSSFTYKGQSVDVRQVGRELSVRYVLGGSVRKAGHRVRISAQLLDARGGTHLWANRFDGSLRDVFDLQDKVAASVAGVIEPALQAVETARSMKRPTANLTAYDLYLRAYAVFWSATTRVPEALRLAEQAIGHDPRFGPALAWAAICCHRLVLDGRSDDPAAERLKGANFGRRALGAAGDDPGTLANAAFALAHFGEDIGAMIALVDRALALNPNFARGWHLGGILRLMAGDPDTAIEHAEASLRLSPRAGIGTQFLTIGAAHFVSRRFDEAVPKLLIALQDDPNSPLPYRYLAACYAHMGRLEDAREIVMRLRTIASVVIPDSVLLQNPDQRERYLSGLRLATIASD
jgi:TolB-like protein